MIVEQVNSAGTAFANGGSKPLLGVAAALLVLLGAAGLVLALDRLIPSGTPQRARVAVPDAPERERTGAAPVSIELPALEVPTMTLAAQVEDVVPGKTKKPHRALASRARPTAPPRAAGGRPPLRRESHRTPKTPAEPEP